MQPRSTPGFRLRRLPLALAACSLLAAALPAGAVLPEGLKVVRGQASVLTDGTQMTVTHSAGAILNWQQFSIGAGQSVYFQQPSSLSAVLNRVTGRDPSHILGSLGSNGRVWLLNPQGVLFGRDARIDVAGLVASTLSITDADWAAGRYHLFDEGAGGALLNQGELRSASGGQILLVGGSAGVHNEGLVHAPGGQVMLAAGHTVELADTTLPHMAVRIAAPAGEALNLGRLVAEGGRVDLLAAMVNQGGIVRADALAEGPGGRIVLDAAERLTLGEGSTTSATGTTGGGLVLQGRQIALLDGALLDASGRAGGGTVFVGGGERGQDPSLRNAEALWMAPGASILADATTAGDGGRIVLWSDRATRAYGHFSARGGALGGDGGFVETSGGWLDARPASVRTGAARGRAGTWLLDPWDITISDEGPDSDISAGPDFESTGSGAVLSTATIAAALEAGNHVTITTTQDACCDAGDIRMLGASIDVTPSAPVSLSLLAERNIVFDFATVRSRGAPLALTLTAANGGQGSVSINASTLATAGGDITIGGRAELCNFRLCDGEFTGGALATDFNGSSHGITITSSLLDAPGGRIALRGFSQVTIAETAGVLIGDGSTLRARDISIVGAVVSDGSLQRTGVKIAGGLVAATNSLDIQGQAYSSNYSFDGSVVGVDILGEVRVDGEGASGEGDSLLSVYGYSEDNAGYGYGGYGFGAAPRYGLGIRGGTGRVVGTGGVDIDLRGEVADTTGNYGLLAEGSGSAYIDASQARDLSLRSEGPMRIQGDLRVSELGGQFEAIVEGFEELRIVNAGITGDPAAVRLQAGTLVIGTELEPARLVFGDATQVMLDASFFLFGTEDVSLPSLRDLDQGLSTSGRKRPLEVLFDVPAASTLLAAGGPITVQADIVSIGADATIYSPHAGLAISIAGSGINGDNLYIFQNAGGASALSAPNGWWEVWSLGPEGDGSFDPGSLVPGYRQYGATYGADSPFFTGANAFLFQTSASLTLVPLAQPVPFTKVYDGTTTLPTAAGGYTFSGLVGNDVQVGFAGYDSKNVGSGKDIVLQPGPSATGIEGPDGAPVYGYALDNSAGAGLGSITPATLNLTGAVVADRVYDGSVNATVTQWNFSGFVPGDDLGVVGSASFADRNVGTAKPVSLLVTDKTGADAGNYVFGTVLTGSATASITPALLTLTSATVFDKVYDGSADAAIDSLVVAGLVGSDVLSFATSAAFDDRHVGSAKAVTVSLDGFSGAAQGNYALGTATSLQTTAAITPASIDLDAATAANKVYDTSTAATVTGFTLAGAVAGDDLSPVGSGAFGDRNVGSGKTVTVTLDGLSGTDAGNYVLGSTVALTTASITPAPVSLAGGGAANKVYDGGTAATPTGLVLSGVLGTDVVTPTGSGSFADRNAGTGKAVTLVLTGLTGADAGNYAIAGASVGTTAAILPAPVTLAGGSAAGKTYDGTVNTTATALTLAGVVGGDTVTGSADARFADADVGAAKPVTLTLLGLAGADAGNYTLGSSLTALTTAAISPALLTYVATPVSITTLDPLPAFAGTVTGFVGGETLASATTGTAVFGSGLEGTPQPGSYAVTGSGLAAVNYSFAQAPGNATALTVLAGSAPPPPPPPPPVSGEEAAGVVTPTERIAALKLPRDVLPQPFVTMPEIGRLLDLMQGLEPGRTDLFGALDVGALGPDRMAAVLAARDEYKKALFGDALARLEQDPSIADAPGCATAQQAASGQCLMVTPLDRDSVISNARVVERLPVPSPEPPVPRPAPPAPPAAGAAPAPAPVSAAPPAARPPVPVVVPAFPDRRTVRQAVLPQIQRKIAVVVGIDEYADPRIPRLANSVRDARAVARSLEATLGYETVVLENPTKAAMFRVFNRLAAETGPDDSVVLYYAGHGELVEKTGLGYWQPSDADVMRPETWVSNADINRVLRGIGARQVALVSDSCFSGSLVGEQRIRGISATQDPAQLLQRRAAVVMSSGGNEPVADSGKNGHSPFAFSLMQALERVPTWRPGSNVFEQVRFQVARQLPQRPQYGASAVGGHEPGADYLFEQRQIEGVTR